MREKRWIIGILALCLLAYAQHQSSAPVPGQVGRYQLYAGPAPMRDADASTQLFRIDTQTGKTWVESVVDQPGGVKASTWTTIQEWEQLNQPK